MTGESREEFERDRGFVESDYRELLLGCGHSRDKRMTPPGGVSQWRGLVTLDRNPAVSPDVICNLDVRDAHWVCEHPGHSHAPFTMGLLSDNWFDEVHAYEVLEHLGAQGDAVAFFNHFCEVWRILKPNGYLCATVPSRFSPWLWGDPSHRRAIVAESLIFLDQEQYIRQLDCEKPTSMSDFRDIYRADFKIVETHDDRKTFYFILRAMKPSRWRERK